MHKLAITLPITALFFSLTLNQASALDCNTIIFSVSTPANFQTFQRKGNTGTILIRGNINNTTGTITAGYHGKTTPLTNVTYNTTNNTFSGRINDQKQGQADLYLNWVKDSCTKSLLIRYVGVGDLFLTAGQSNQESFGLNHHYSTHPTLKATMFGNDYKWQELRDPVENPINQVDLVSLGNVNGGTYFPYLATKIMAYTNVPVAFIPAALGSTFIENWERDNTNPFNRNTLYGSAAYRAKLQGGVRAVLWWQGESNVARKTTTEVYEAKLTQLAANFATDIGEGTKLMAYRLGMVLYPNHPGYAAVDQAILNAASKSPHIILGPYLLDIDIAQPEETNKIHFVTDAQQSEVASRVFVRLRDSGLLDPYLKGDLNTDGSVNLEDINIFKNQFKTTMLGDVNKDTKVDALDYAILVANFGK